MPVSHRMIPHWKYNQNRYLHQTAIWVLYPAVPGNPVPVPQGKIKVAACHIQIMNWQFCKIACLNGIFKCSPVCPASAECPEPGKNNPVSDTTAE